MNGSDVANVDAILGAEDLDVFALQDRKRAPGVPEPHSTQTVRELDQHACPRKVVTTTIGGPDVIGQAVQAMTSERHPHPSAAILCDGLEEGGPIRHLSGQVDSNQTPVDHTPQTAFCAEPE